MSPIVRQIAREAPNREKLQMSALLKSIFDDLPARQAVETIKKILDAREDDMVASLSLVFMEKPGNPFWVGIGQSSECLWDVMQPLGFFKN